MDDYYFGLCILVLAFIDRINTHQGKDKTNSSSDLSKMLYHHKLFSIFCFRIVAARRGHGVEGSSSSSSSELM